jgi:hypothetical protein
MLWLLLIFMPLAAEAQWDQVVMLTHDSLEHGAGPFVVDDSLRLHAFDVRISHATSPQHSSLYYQRFDSWGNPLGAAVDILPDSSHWLDYGSGVLLDRNQVIHVIWSRVWDAPSASALYYARYNTQGDRLSLVELPQPQDYFFMHCCVDVVQDSAGVIWVEFFSLVMTLSEDGEVLTPFQFFVPSFENVEHSMLAVGPSGEVWTSYRDTDSSGQSVRLMRLDTTAQEFEIVVDDQGVPGVQCNVEAFYIDTTNAFHFMLYRDGDGIFYERDPRDGDLPDTSVVDPSPWGTGDTDFTLVGGDTLLYLWGQELPQSGINRVGFHLTGERAFGPILSSPWISLVDRFPWKEGSMWVPGGGGDGTTPYSQLVMIHIPGPNEPPNSASDPARPPNVASRQLQVFPQPSSGMIALAVPSQRPGESTEVTVFNTLGQIVYVGQLPSNQKGVVQLRLPPSVAAGRYYISVRTGSEVLTSPLIYFP